MRFIWNVNRFSSMASNQVRVLNVAEQCRLSWSRYLYEQDG